ncbi:hypothetical protein PAPYR_13528 [Paratrimastix pyriformis]|uniref:Uncharacterized protein n=1 Tax=Paratrimastix pyriformis TaxID=342808 RepID=A0ABQ8U049_9EUKA|nr:hypothetical protein PAPYR_13528 [Paratrimastix pyriformis]
MGRPVPSFAFPGAHVMQIMLSPPLLVDNLLPIQSIVQIEPVQPQAGGQEATAAAAAAAAPVFHQYPIKPGRTLALYHIPANQTLGLRLCFGSQWHTSTWTSV